MILTEHCQPTRILLSPGNCLSFLNYAYPDGIPIATALISFSGFECYEFKPLETPLTEVQEALGKAINSPDYPEICFYKFFEYQRIFIPVEWAQPQRSNPGKE
jgi:hypothetical protein